MKYGNWNVSVPDMGAVNALTAAGYAPLTAMILSSRGIGSAAAAAAYLDCSVQLIDPYRMKDMDRAAGRVGLAMTRGEKVAVFGDYDVDGITATCLLTSFLRQHGVDTVSYIPGRLEEGYGLNSIAIHQLHSQGVQLIITVDCGITALEEAKLCRELGIDLVITDHHECKDALPEAIAVVDPHRPDCGYPNKTLSGVGVAFKLASALTGSQEEVLADYADMVCLGTVADVMPLQGENRVFVTRGLEALRHTNRPGISALMAECSCAPENVSASTIGFILAPRINAAGRMGQIDLALELFLTDSEERARCLAQGLCALNHQRQQVEAQIFHEATAMLPGDRIPFALVLASDRWHQGVVGIVASRIAEEYNCPTFLICLDGEHGKASSRSFGGFNLFSALSRLSGLLESYGGHELAAGFTIHRDNIDEFRRRIVELSREYFSESGPETNLAIDCAVSPELLTIRGIDALEILEPCGNSCPKPVLMAERVRIERITLVGGGRHMRLRLRFGRSCFNAIYFSATPQSAFIEPGDLVDVAFNPQVNEFRGERNVQLNIVDIRPSCSAPCDLNCEAYCRLLSSEPDRRDAELLLPQRSELAMVWRYLAGSVGVNEHPACLCRKIVRWSGVSLSLNRLMVCLDIFAELGLIRMERIHSCHRITPTPGTEKTDLNRSLLMQKLLRAKES